jgi:hypothetical protein
LHRDRCFVCLALHRSSLMHLRCRPEPVWRHSASHLRGAWPMLPKAGTVCRRSTRPGNPGIGSIPRSRSYLFFRSPAPGKIARTSGRGCRIRADA